MVEHRNQHLDDLFHALANTTRREIVGLLSQRPHHISELVPRFDMSLAAVSKHVQTLERAGLVRRRRNGREHTLSLDARPLRQVVRWTSRYERFWNEHLDRLEAFFTQKGQTP